MSGDKNGKLGAPIMALQAVAQDEREDDDSTHYLMVAPAGEAKGKAR